MDGEQKEKKKKEKNEKKKKEKKLAKKLKKKEERQRLKHEKKMKDKENQEYAQASKSAFLIASTPPAVMSDSMKVEQEPERPGDNLRSSLLNMIATPRSAPPIESPRSRPISPPPRSTSPPLPPSSTSPMPSSPRSPRVDGISITKLLTDRSAASAPTISPHDPMSVTGNRKSLRVGAPPPPVSGRGGSEPVLLTVAAQATTPTQATATQPQVETKRSFFSLFGSTRTIQPARTTAAPLNINAGERRPLNLRAPSDATLLKQAEDERRRREDERRTHEAAAKVASRISLRPMTHEMLERMVALEKNNAEEMTAAQVLRTMQDEEAKAKREEDRLLNRRSVRVSSVSRK